MPSKLNPDTDRFEGRAGPLGPPYSCPLLALRPLQRSRRTFRILDTIRLFTLAFVFSVKTHAQTPAVPEVQVYRTMMPDSGPSSFAVSLPGSLGFCFDPNRAGINYVWQGEFVDLEPTWKAKINRPAEVRAPIVYRESGAPALRFDGRIGGEAPVFKGYRFVPDGVEFSYVLDGIPVQEEIRSTSDGRLVRRFRLERNCSGWTYTAPPMSHAQVSATQARWDESLRQWSGPACAELTVTIAPPARRVP